MPALLFNAALFPDCSFCPLMQLRTHAKRIWMPWRQREALFDRLHFATVPVSRVPGALPGVLREWTYGQRWVGAVGTRSSHASTDFIPIQEAGHKTCQSGCFSGKLTGLHSMTLLPQVCTSVCTG